MNIASPVPTLVSGLLPHRFAALLPRLGTNAQARLDADVAANGVLLPVVLYEGAVLDGRHRVVAAYAGGLRSVPAATFTGTDAEALAYVTSQNIHRRQLNASQLALCAARMRGVDTGSGYPTQIEMANAFGVSIRYVRDAERLLASRSSIIGALVARVDDGSMSLHEALGEAFPRPARERPTRIDPMPDNPAISEIPAIDPAAGNVITQAACAMVMLQGDPTAWLRTLTPEEFRTLVPMLETFARHAISRAEEEAGDLTEEIAAAPPPPAPVSTRAVSPGRTAPDAPRRAVGPTEPAPPNTGAGVQTLAGGAGAIAAARAAGERRTR